MEQSYQGQRGHLYIAMSLLCLHPSDKERKESLQQYIFLPRIAFLAIGIAPLISDANFHIGYQIEKNVQLSFSVS